MTVLAVLVICLIADNEIISSVAVLAGVLAGIAKISEASEGRV